MGIDYNGYLGPYLEVGVKVVEKIRDNCKDTKNCPTPSPSIQFCSQCGIKLAERFEIIEVEEPSINEEELFGDVLTSTNYMISPKTEETENGKVRRRRYIVNKHRKKTPNRELRISLRDGNLAHDMSDLNVQEEIDWFKGVYADEISKLENAGAFVTIRWGYLQWCS